MILDLLFPEQCMGCWSSWSYLCAYCKKQLKPHPEICPITHKNSHSYTVRQDLLTEQSPLTGCIVLFRFDPLIKKLITQLKYYHRSHISSFLWKRLALAIQSHEILSQLLTHNWQLLTSYVPSHRIRHHITKWYNQSQLLAWALCKELWLNKPKTLCKKIKHTHSQVGMTKDERKQNLSDAFRVTDTIPAGSTILIVDDVLTSGATMIELATTIKQSQPDCKVRGICVARNG